MKPYVLTLIFIAVLTVALPVYAGEAEDYISSELQDSENAALENGYTILDSYLGLVGSNGQTFTFELAPGSYHLFAAGGLRIMDLDCYAYDEDGNEIGSDTEPDKIPIVLFRLDETTTVSFEISAWAFEGNSNSGYFCLVVAVEDEGEILSFEGDVIEAFPENESDMYKLEAESILNNWLAYEEEMGSEIVDSGLVVANYDGYSLGMDLDDGYYQVYAQPDSRCPDLDITVNDSDWNQLAEDHMEDNLPICEFMLLDSGTVHIDFEVYMLNENVEETWVSYVLIRKGGTSREERMIYIEDRMTALRDANVGEDITVFEEGYYEISEDDNPVTFDIELEPGSYYAEAQGGVAIPDLDMFAYNEAGDLLDSDTLDDNYPLVVFEISETQTVKFEIEAVDFATGFDEDFFAWILTNSTGSYYDDYLYDDMYQTYDDETLMAELANRTLVRDKLIDLNGEDVLDTFTDSILLDENDQRWTTSYHFDEGVYRLYVQGDGISITDTDLYIYGMGEDPILQDSLPDNSPIVQLTVGAEGADLTLEVHAFTLNYDSGYFNLTITRLPGDIDPLAAIENELREWKMTAEGKELDVIGEYVGTIYAGFQDGVARAGDEEWTIELTPGYYELYASGGANVENLDMSVTTADGRMLGEDFGQDNIPMVRFYLNETASLTIQFQARAYYAGHKDGYFCLVVATEGGGEVLSFEGDVL